VTGIFIFFEWQGTIRGEIRERKDRVEKLKIRHDLAIQVIILKALFLLVVQFIEFRIGKSNEKVEDIHETRIGLVQHSSFSPKRFLRSHRVNL
jgi:hypothetical protein